MADNTPADLRRYADRIADGETAMQQRDALIRRLRAEGMTLQRIADIAGLTKQRVGQIVKGRTQ